jgi:hypothetical protein
MQALPLVGQLGDRLPLASQRLRGHKALEGNRVFPREHVVHGPTQLVGEDGERLGFAVFVFPGGKVRFARLTLADEQHGSFRKGPTQVDVANLFAGRAQPFTT